MFDVILAQRLGAHMDYLEEQDHFAEWFDDFAERNELDGEEREAIEAAFWRAPKEFIQEAESCE